MIKYVRILSIVVLSVIVIFSFCSCACNSGIDTADITSSNIDTKEVTSGEPIKNSENAITKNQVIIASKDIELEGFWHNTLDFSKGMGLSYEFFNDGLFDFKDANGSEYSGSWDMKENDILELTIEDKALVYAYNIEYIDKDSATNDKALIIDGQKFWKMIKPVDVIGGFPLYINYDYNLKLEDYQNRKLKEREPTTVGSSENIIIYCDKDLYDFRLSEISFNDGVNYDFEKVIYYFGDLASDSYIKITTNIPEGMPYEAVSFTDENGIVYSYILHYNGRDGSTCAYPYKGLSELDLEGFWHDAPDFSNGIGSSYEFFDYGWLYDFKNGDERESSGLWDIKGNGALELTAQEGEDETVQNHNFEYVAKDDATGYPALIIDGQKFWKSNKPIDVIDGSPIYINYDGNLKIKNYLNKEIIMLQEGEREIEHIKIFSDIDLYDFKIRSVDFNLADFNVYPEDVKFSADVLSSDNIIEYVTTTPEGIPNEAISFTDRNGITHSYVLAYNGRDGSTCATKTEVIENKDIVE